MGRTFPEKWHYDGNGPLLEASISSQGDAGVVWELALCDQLAINFAFKLVTKAVVRACRSRFPRFGHRPAHACSCIKFWQHRFQQGKERPVGLFFVPFPTGAEPRLLPYVPGRKSFATGRERYAALFAATDFGGIEVDV